MDYEFESIIPWNGEHDTGRDARQKLDRNFAKIKANFQELGDAKFVTTAFFARIFGIDGEDGAQVGINDTEAVITAIKVKFGLYSESFVSAKGKNPDSGSEPGGSTTLAGLTDVSITGTPGDGQVLAFDATMNKWKPVDMEATAGIDEEELLQILTQKGYATQTWVTQKGYATQQWVTQQSYAKTSVRIKAGTGLTGGGTLAQDVTLSLATVGTAGTYTKVTVDAYGRVTGHASLTQGDIPALAISKITGLQAALDAKLNKSVFEELFEKVWVSGYGYAIRAKLAFYSDDWISAKGLNSDAGSTTGGVDENEVLQIVAGAGYITASALNGYATQSWVTGLGYMSQSTADGRYLRKNLGTIGNGTDLNDYGASGLYFVSASDYTSIANFPEKSQYGYGILANLMNADKVGIQWYVPDYNYTMAVRTAWTAGRWNDWHYLLTNRNYNSYTVTKTGGGASGTWGIGISGNAASATKLQTARTIWGKSFDGTESVSGDLRNVGSIIPLSGYYDLGSSSNYWNYIWAYKLSLIDNGTNYICSGNGDNATYNTYNIKIHSHWGIGITGNEDICRLVIDARTGSITMRGALSVGSYVQIGSARLYYDSGNNALYVQKSDGSTCGFYATGFVSAKGGNSSSGSAVAGVTELSELDDVAISSPVNGQALVYRNGYWRNETVSGGGGSASVAWSDITGKPTWIGSSKPSYSFSEITGTPSVTISSSNATNLTVNVEGTRRTISDLYAEYLGGTTKAGLFTGMTYSGNRLSVTVGGTTKSVTINAGVEGNLTDIDSIKFTPGTNNRNMYIDANGIRILTTSSSGWTAGLLVYNSANTTKVGAICGGYGTQNGFTYAYFGGDYQSPGMAILANKNVGIGTTSPSYKLHVSGTAYASGGFQNGSDIRYKHILRDIPLTVEDVANAPSFIFRWTDDTAPGEQAGTSAQYWQPLLPQVVTEADGRLSMQYGKTALAAAITTARTVVDHEQRIRKLEQQLLNAV